MLLCCLAKLRSTKNVAVLGTSSAGEITTGLRVMR